MISILYDTIRVVKLLMKRLDLVGKSDDDGNTAAHLAAKYGHSAELELLLDVSFLASITCARATHISTFFLCDVSFRL